MTTVLTMLAAYLFGGIPFGLLLARWVGVDVLSAGSGNIGATNVARTAGRWLGVLTLLLDVVKGVVPTLIGAALGGPRLAAGAGCAAILGHTLSPYISFRGGKGVATAAGVFLVLAPVGTLGAIGVFVVAVWATGVVSIGSILAALTLPLGVALEGASPEAQGAAGLTMLLVLARHLPNLRRLLRGEEPRWQRSRMRRPAPGPAVRDLSATEARGPLLVEAQAPNESPLGATSPGVAMDTTRANSPRSR